MTTALLILAWIVASFICAGLWALAGLRISRLQERNRPVDMSWPGKPLIYIEGELVPPTLEQKFRQAEGIS